MVAGARFANLGVLSFILVLSLTAVGHEILKLGEQSSYLIALIVAFFVNFLGARHYVYKASHAPLGRQLLLFFISSLGFRAGEFISFVLLHTFVGVQYLLAVGLIMVVSFVVKYLFFKSFVFS